MPDKILIDTAIGSVVDTAIAGAVLENEGATADKEPAFTRCSSCNTRLKGRHCHHCGQVADTFHRPVWALFAEVLEGYLGLDGRVWRTIPALLLSPGKVTAQYLQGVRQPYISPIRLFLLSSLIFFLVFALVTSGQNFAGIQGSDPAKAGARPAISDTLAQVKDELTGLQADPALDADTAQGLKLAQTGIDMVDRELKRQQTVSKLGASRFTLRQNIVCKLRENAIPEDPSTPLCIALKKEQKQRDLLAAEAVGDNKNSNPDKGDGVVPIPISSAEAGEGDADVSIDAQGLQNTFSLETRRFLVDNVETALNDPDQYRATLGRWAPRLAFILAPTYGLLLALTFFWRRRFYIYDHMVVALHFHAFLFLFLVLLVPVGMLINTALAGVIFVLWSNIYLYRLIRRVYGTSRVGAAVRVIVLDSIYQILLAQAFLGLLLLGIVFV